MKILGTIFLILGLLAAVKSFSDGPPPQVASEAYKTGRRVGQIGAPLLLIGLGLRLLLRDGGGYRSASSRPASPGRYSPPAAPPPAYPPAIPVKIQCSCEQFYEFEVEPVAGRMPTRVACPTCGVDGTDAANASIAQTLAMRAATPAWTQPAPQRKLHPALLVGIGVVAVVGFLVVSSLVRQLLFRSRALQSRPSAPSAEIERPSSQPASGPGAGGGKSPPGKPGTARESAPVPPDATSVDVLWGSRWYPGTILRRDGQRAFIHYDGWGSSSDEWVTPDRLRPRRSSP